MQSNININTHLQVISPQSIQNTTDLRLQAYEKPVNFLITPHGVCFSFRNNLTNLASFAEVSVPIESITPWCRLSGNESNTAF